MRITTNQHLAKALVVTLLLMSLAQAQETKAPRTLEPGVQIPSRSGEPEAVYDDDGGRVFILRRNFGPLAPARQHGGDVITAPEQYSIFLGAGWGDGKRRSIETSLTGLLAARTGMDDRATLERCGVRDLLASSFSYEAPIEFTNNAVSDLQVRAELVKLFKDGALPAPSANTVYVVYLAPGIRSTLGTMFGGKHYVAYHNYFNTESGEIRYVVVPFDANQESLQRTAKRALMEAIINPSGNGWY